MEFKYSTVAFEDPSAEGAKCCRKVVVGRKVVVVRSLLTEYARVLHEVLLIIILMFGSETKE